MTPDTAILSPPQLCVMLAGGIHASPLERALGSSVMDLPIDRERALIEGWLERVGTLNREGHEPVRTVVALGADTVSPRERPEIGEDLLTFLRDPNDFRGPAGVVRDAAGAVHPDRDILICEASMWGALDLRSVLWAHRDGEADITVCRNPDGSPSGVYLARGWTLELIQEKGFMDLKEQWFTKARNNGASIRVFDLAAPGQRWMRTRRDYLRMCRAVADGESGVDAEPGMFTRGESSVRSWSIVDGGARVHEEALVCESVVFPGAVIEKDAIVVRSVVGRGARVGAGERVVDAVASEKGVTHG